MEWVVLVVLISALLFVFVGIVRIHQRLDRLDRRMQQDFEELAQKWERRFR